MFLEVLVHFTGSVQGVGFRYRVKRIVANTPLAGHVENLVDGRVQLGLQGDEQELRKALAAIQERMASWIDQVETHWRQPHEILEGFHVR